MAPNIVINATNLHSGGGVQVAASFIYELYTHYINDPELPYHIYVSDTVNENLSHSINRNKFKSFSVFNTYGLKKPANYNYYFTKKIDVLFTIFGPVYFKTNATVNIVGFAQSWIAYPKNIAYKKISIFSAIKNKIKFKLQELYFKRADILIVEQEHVKNALVRIGFNKNNILTVYNCYSEVFNDPSVWEPIQINKSKKFTLGYLGRGYPHKNLKILTCVNDILKNKYNLETLFLFTLSKKEMNDHMFDNIENFESIGEININQCPNFYRNIDALIFPSLLESFSATPVEAMKMKVPVIASDLPFVRSICKDSAFYFNPLDPYSIAESIFYAYSNKELCQQKISAADKIVSQLPTAKDRANDYIKIINATLNKYQEK